MLDKNNPLSPHLRDARLPRFTSSHLISEEHSSRHAILPHMHEKELELLYVYSGTGRYMVNNHFYSVKEGDIIIINAGVLHGENPTDERRMCTYSVWLTDVAFIGLPDNCLTGEGIVPVLSTGMLSQQVGELVRLLYLLSADHRGLSALCNSLAASLLLLTHEMLSSRERHADDHTRTEPSAIAERVLRYLDMHFQEPLTLGQIAADLNANEYYIAHTFKDEFHIPPMQYVMKRRIGEAQMLLADTELLIADIAYQLSFSSLSHFNYMFKKYVGTSPGKYRQMLREMDEH